MSWTFWSHNLLSGGRFGCTIQTIMSSKTVSRCSQFVRSFAYNLCLYHWNSLDASRANDWAELFSNAMHTALPQPDLICLHPSFYSPSHLLSIFNHPFCYCFCFLNHTYMTANTALYDWAKSVLVRFTKKFRTANWKEITFKIQLLQTRYPVMIPVDARLRSLDGINLHYSTTVSAPQKLRSF